MSKTSLFKSLLLVGAMALAPMGTGGAAFAHGSMKPKHGGQLVMSGETQVELVRSPKGVSVYVSEEDEPIAAAGLSGKLIITEGSKKREAVLKSGPANRLDAPGVKIANGAKVTVSLLTKSTQARTNASFTVK
jgi:hypothetical protein